MQMEQKNPSTIAAYAHAFASALESRGVDSQTVFDEAGIAMHATSDPFKRLTTQEVSSLFRASVKATGDPCFGIAVGECMQPGNMHALGFALLASTTLRDFYGGEGEAGYFKQELQVYGRDGEACRTCDTPISVVVLGQRSTFYCKNCQH